MSVEINYIKKKISSPKSNYILFCNDKFNTNSLKKYLLNSEISYINDLLKSWLNLNISLVSEFFVFKRFIIKNSHLKLVELIYICLIKYPRAKIPV